jgi:RNA-directed DNA polymerase
MTVKALMPVRTLNLVVPLAQKATDMRTTETVTQLRGKSGAVALLIDASLRQGDVDSTQRRSTPRPTLVFRTSTTAIRTTTTRVTSAGAVSSAESNLPTFAQLVQAYLDCRKSKRNSSSCKAFEDHLERNLCGIYEELISGTYKPSKSICFVITRPKHREVWAAEFRDRVVHHLLYSHIAPRFIAGFVAGSSACIPGRGTLYAAKRLEHGIRSITQNWSQPAFYLKMDLANFFVAIDKHVLFTQIATKVHAPFWLELARIILFHDPRDNVEVRGSRELLAKVPPHKSLFNAQADTGLPIGNLSSQFFANVHLNLLDQFCVHQLKARHYVRYVDDFILLDTSAQRLNTSHDRIAQFLPERLGAHLNPSKTILQPVDRGVDFVGHVIKPWRRTTRKRTLNTALSRIRTIPDDETFEAGNSYLGLLRQASHSHSDRARIANALRLRDHSVQQDLTKIFRKSV